MYASIIKITCSSSSSKERQATARAQALQKHDTNNDKLQQEDKYYKNLIQTKPMLLRRLRSFSTFILHSCFFFFKISSACETE